MTLLGMAHVINIKFHPSSIRACSEPLSLLFLFLDASKHLYKRVCLSVGWLVSRSVGWSVGQFVGWSVRWSVTLFWAAAPIGDEVL